MKPSKTVVPWLLALRPGVEQLPAALLAMVFVPLLFFIELAGDGLPFSVYVAVTELVVVSSLVGVGLRVAAKWIRASDTRR